MVQNLACNNSAAHLILPTNCQQNQQLTFMEHIEVKLCINSGILYDMQSGHQQHAMIMCNFSKVYGC